jgi:hypothetical protein
MISSAAFNLLVWLREPAWIGVSFPGLLVFAFLIFILLFGSQRASAQDSGIAVGAPKVYDNRSLELMLEQFEQSLRIASLVDKSQLTGAIGQFQGSEQTELSRDIQAAVNLGLPGAVKPAASGSSQSADKAAGADKSSSGSGGSSGSSAATKTAAPADSGGALPDAVTKKYGIAAEDILNEQVNLTYQIFNLRMLLERSLSDRDFDGKPRLQAVLGFQISLDPPKRYKGDAAVVEVRLLPVPPNQDAPAVSAPAAPAAPASVPAAAPPPASVPAAPAAPAPAPAAPPARPISLVAMMPQEKTYNVATLTTKVNQFGGSAIVKVVNIGYSERRRGQTFFVVKDTDTFAFERNKAPAAGESVAPLVFGWTFRPVLNRPSVEAGTRQVFAVIALPQDDSFAGTTNDYKVSVQVNTYWVPFDRKSGTRKRNPREDSFGGRAQADVSLYSARESQNRLSATLTSLDWSEVGDEGALVNVFGDNFYTGTTAIIGGSVMDQPVNGLFLRTDHHLQALTTVRALARGDAKINGRYGVPRDLVDPSVEKELKQKPGWGFQSMVLIWDANPDRATVTLTLQIRGPKDDVRPSLFGRKPIITVGKQAFRPSDVAIDDTATCSVLDAQGATTKKPCLQFTVDVPSETLNGSSQVAVSVPFLGQEYSLSQPTYEPFRAAKATLLKDGDTQVYSISGTRFGKDVKLIADTEYGLGNDLKKLTDEMLEFTQQRDRLKDVRQFVILKPGAKPLVIPIPTGKPETPKPSITDGAKADLDSSVGVDYKGKNLNAIKKFAFEGDDLKFEAGKGGEAVTVFVTRKVTSKAGWIELLGTTEDGSIVRARLQIVAPAAAEKEKK